MKRSIRYIPERRDIEIRMRRDHPLPRDLLRALKQAKLVEGTFIDASRRRSKTLVITLAEHDGLPFNNLLERLARWLSQAPGHRVVHDPWECGGGAVDIEFAVELVVKTILGFDESKLAALVY